MKKLFGYGLLVSIIEVIVGILLLINPEAFTSGIITAFGAVIAVLGLWQLIGYFRAQASQAAIGGKLSKGILMILLGAFCLIKTRLILATFSVVTVLYGVMILVTGVGKFEKAVDMLRLKKKYWFVALIAAVLTLVVAALILINPFGSTKFLWGFIGVTLIIQAIMDIAAHIFSKKGE